MNTIWNEFVLLFNTNPALISFTWTVIAFGLGTWFGHWLAIKRDRLKEFNAVADPIAVVLMQKISLAQKGQTNNAQISSSDILKLSRMMTKRNALKLSKAFSTYQEGCKNCGTTSEHGDYSFHNPELFIAGAEQLLTFLKRR
ncbi:hypothetical protein DEO48_00685 [Enterobacter sp. CGMCC 5087]|nr:hypothetical protein DEO48_00685 [Enterobacter sp. CGMCC 5087]